jgi:hypothetical protein
MSHEVKDFQLGQRRPLKTNHREPKHGYDWLGYGRTLSIRPERVPVIYGPRGLTLSKLFRSGRGHD